MPFKKESYGLAGREAKMAKKDVFFGYVDKKVVCRSGEVTIPLRTTDLTSMLAAFPVKTSLLRPLIPARLQPLGFLGTSVLTIGGMEYREMSIGPYNEIVVLVPVRYTGPLPPQASAGFVLERVGVYVMIISVTTQIALDAGLDIWGYPKFLSEITFQDQGERRACRWEAEGEEILSCSVGKEGITVPFDRKLVDFSVRGNEIMKNALRGRFQLRLSSGKNVQISFGPHPVGQKLAGMIETRRALSGGYMEHGMGVLDAPEWSAPL